MNHPAPTQISFSYALLGAILVTLLLGGFITNFLSFTELNMGTMVIDFLIGVLLMHTVVVVLSFYYSGKKVSLDYFAFAAFWCLLLLITILKLSFIDTNPLREKVLGLRNTIFYASPLIYFPLLLRKSRHIDHSLASIVVIGVLLCLYAIFQFKFSSYLPLSFLALRGEGTFQFYDEEIVRPTALLGNTIIFASFTITLFSILLSKYVTTKKKVYLFYIAIIITANIFTYTRAALVGLLLSSGTIFFLHYGRFTLNFVLKFLAGCFLVIISILIVGYFNKDSFIVKRVTGQEASTISSTTEHYNQIDNAIEYLKQNYLLGAGTGTQGPSSDTTRMIITDGYWFQLFLENGVFLGLFHLSLYLLCFYYALQTFFHSDDRLLRQLCLAFLGASMYFFAGSFINSALIGRINYILYWVLFSLLLAQRLIINKR
ncbi:O-antigen ligase family protein [Rufibacter latericius]|uniref:O-antigen ligase domain-containing protein n=1 Tax=Rufibacter latericius TaxID=2487040 RepID=A0A3M9MB91_9BACT|nr:O-antigen ligase family protein [Rufibacter latericius]RNI22455.1 O-antigen ligase domain-containing protein [Rufibacter latericius]